jgi:hypothetical protein
MSVFDRFRAGLSSVARSFSVEALAGGDVQAEILAALAQTGRLRQRESPLQPPLILWLVLGLTIFRRDSIPAVLDRLVSGLRERLWGLRLKPVTDGAIAHARTRIGVRPLRVLFRRLGEKVNPVPSFHGLRTWIMDGSHLTMPDTPANVARFGRRVASRGRAAFPELKLVFLQDAVSRLVRDAVFGLWAAAERPLAVRLLRHVGPGDLLLLDRGFYGAWFLAEILGHGVHFLCRIPKTAKLRPVQGTSKRSGDYRAWIEAYAPRERGTNPSRLHRGQPARRKVRILVRVIEYTVRGFGHVRLATSLTDGEQISARDLVLEYHRRWEIELGLDEVKTHQSAHAGGVLRTIFRSKTPRGVMQEAYALLCGYNLVRRTIQAAATKHGLFPDEIGFVDSLRAISHMVPRMAAAAACRLKGLYDQLLRDIAGCRIPRPRRHRRYPRVVRVKMSKFKLKRAHHRQEFIPFPQEIRIGA